MHSATYHIWLCPKHQRILCESQDLMARARKLGNPRILKICFKTLRHWKATMEYHKTKDIIHVKTLLGHENINNTMIYIHLEAMLFATTTDEFHVRVTAAPKEIVKLLEVGFEYVCDHDGAKFFRKRK